MNVSKYNASGNDFVIFMDLKKRNRSELAKQLCDRFNGIGADGMIVILPHAKYDFEWEFYNSNGSRASMCGNGSRAAALYAFNQKIAKKMMSFLTESGVINAWIQRDGVVVELGGAKQISAPFSESGFNWHFYNTGVPHLVTFCENLDEFDLDIAKIMREKYNANVNFATIGDTICVRTFERGVEGETNACGTGMAACFYAAHNIHKSPSTAIIVPKSKEALTMRLEDDKIFFKGKVTHCFDANYFI